MSFDLSKSRRKNVGRSFSVAIWILGLVALAQVAAVAWAVINQFAVGEKAKAPFDKAAILDQERLMIDEIGLIEEQQLVAELKSRTSRKPQEILPDVQEEEVTSMPEIEDGRVLKLLAVADDLRGSGDTLGALEKYRQANIMAPGRPELLSRIADLYGQIGRGDKAEDYWKRVHEIGPEMAGEWYRIADFKLRGGKKPNLGAEQSVLSVNEILETRHEVQSGEKLSLLMGLQKRAGEVIDPQAVQIHVLFYDLVNGETVEQTTADPPEILWRTGKADWTESEELLEAVYFHPELTDDQLRDLGSREYYGYVIKLYYADILQDVIASPRRLVDFSPALISDWQ